MPKLYIAFGSNLSKKQMRFRCPTARPLGKFIMRDAQLVFRSVADLDFVPGATTPCGLWSINTDDERSLDRYEGVNSGAYFKSEAIQLNYCGRKRPALIYLMNSQAIFPPSQTYVDTIRRGYKDFDLDEKFLDDAIARSFLDRDEDEEMLARRERQLDTRLHSQLVEMPESVLQARQEANEGT
jgi:AIG2-like family